MNGASSSLHSKWRMILFLFTIPVFAAAQDPLGSIAPSENRLASLWSRYEQAKIAQDEEARKQVFDEIKAMMTDGGGTIYEKASYLFLEEGYQELDRGRHESARRELLHAAELNPYLWPAFSGLAQIRLERDSAWEPFIRLNVKGALEAFSMENSYFVLDAIIWFVENLIWILMTCFIATALLLCLKYCRPFYATTVGSFEERGMDPLYAHLLSIAFLLLPLLLGANIFLVAAIYIVMFMPFLETRERYAAYLIFLAPILIPFMSQFAAGVSAARSDPLLRAHLVHFYDGETEERIRYLEEHAGGGVGADLSLFTIAHLQKIEGRISEALDTYSRIEKRSPLWARAQVNRGNIHYIRKEYQDAANAYQAALEADESLPLAELNLSFTRRRQGDLQDSERLRQKALREIDHPQRYQLADGPVDATADPRARLWAAIFSDTESLGGMISADMTQYYPAVLALVILIAAMVHLRFRNPHLLARDCQKCGRVFFQSDSPEGEWCSQCVNLYIRKEDLPSEAKIRKHEEVQRFNRNKRMVNIIGQVLLPGSRKIMGGNPLSGLVILLVWCALLVFIFSPVNRITYDFMRYVGGPVLLTVLTIAVALVYWAIFGLRSIWQED